MNYAEIKNVASSGIDFFSDKDGVFDCISQAGGVKIVNGVEIDMPEISFKVKGFIRSPRAREVDGEMILATDKLGVFNSDAEIKNGYVIIIDGERYRISEARPIRPTGLTVAYRPILRRVSVHG